MRSAFGKFSVIIPTLQRSPELWPLVEQCAAHPLVAEVLVINNAPEPLWWESPKVRVLEQETNIYVNPAWNLGAREAAGEFLAIVNDDVRFHDDVFHVAAKVLRAGRFSMIGPSQSCLTSTAEGSPSFRFGSLGTTPFGTLMMLRRADYVPIPHELLIWGGDHWLMLNQKKPVAKFTRTYLRTDMSTTSGSPEFRAMREAEDRRAHALCSPLRRKRWWHWPASVLVRVRIVQNWTRGVLRRSHRVLRSLRGARERP